MKNNNSFWTFLAWLIITIALVVGLAIYQNKNVSRKDKTVAVVSTSTNTISKQTLSLTEIGKHNLASDCWLLINNKVYNVTAAINSHPGGTSPITKYCGQEATQAFNTKDIGRPHSSRAESQLAAYYIGDLNQAISQSQIQQNVQQTNAVVPPVGGGDREDD